MSGLVRVGDFAPDFELPDQHGDTVRLTRLLAAGPVVLFFYPLAMSRGCTAESCHFRDLAGEFESVGARVLGVSADAVDRQQQFTERHGFGFPLLSDVDRRVAKDYGVKRPGPLFNRRMTFVIGEGRRVLGAFHSEVNMEKHADEALSLLRSLPRRGEALDD